MIILKPNVEELKQNVFAEDKYYAMLRQIERVGRICYKSEDKITDDSCYKFVDMLKSHAHGAMLEHGTIYLTVGPFFTLNMFEMCNYFETNPYSKYKQVVRNNARVDLITTNYRVICEAPQYIQDTWQDFVTEPSEEHEKRRCFEFICNRGVSHEFVRHRVMSPAQESQRYCNYSKDKYGNQVTFIQPIWQNDDPDEKLVEVWKDTMSKCENAYFELLRGGYTPQLARGVLPNDTKTDLVLTGFESDWEHFFELRCAKDAHPEAQYLANICKELFELGK